MFFKIIFYVFISDYVSFFTHLQVSYLTIKSVAAGWNPIFRQETARNILSINHKLSPANHQLPLASFSDSGLLRRNLQVNLIEKGANFSGTPRQGVKIIAFGSNIHFNEGVPRL